MVLNSILAWSKNIPNSKFTGLVSHSIWTDLIMSILACEYGLLSYTTLSAIQQPGLLSNI